MIPGVVASSVKWAPQGEPTNVVLTRTTDIAGTVSFTGVTGTPKVPVTGHKLLVMGGNGEMHWFTGSSPISFSGLTRGVFYWFYVYAYNEVDDGPTVLAGSFTANPDITVSGGTIEFQNFTSGGTKYRGVQLSQESVNYNIIVTAAPTNGFKYIVAGGGGGGGFGCPTGPYSIGGGGGGGGLRTGSGLVLPNGTNKGYVGAGGAGGVRSGGVDYAPASGGDTSVKNPSNVDIIVAKGGGRGGQLEAVLAGSGGSGGGSPYNTPGNTLAAGTGTAGQGYDGAAGAPTYSGGGGGAGGAGSGSTGGAGVTVGMPYANWNDVYCNGGNGKVYSAGVAKSSGASGQHNYGRGGGGAIARYQDIPTDANYGIGGSGGHGVIILWWEHEW